MWRAIDKLAIFGANVFTAFKFAAYDYDVQLRRTKSPTQRIIIWTVIFSALAGAIFLLMVLLKVTIKSVVKNRYTEGILQR